MESIGLIGKKIGMSREFFPIGISVPVTIIKIEKGRVIDLITKDKRGYEAIRVGFGKIKLSKLTKSMKGFYSKKNTEPKKYLKEYRVENVSNYKEGNEIGLEIFKDAKFVDVTSKTIGKGFAGVMKKYNFSGLRASHGVSVSHRSGGSTGQRQDPGKVFKGKKMPGHMGDKSRTILNLQVIGSDLNNDLIYLRGSIPGSKNTLVFIRNSVKKINKKTILEKNKITNKRDKISEEIDASKKSIITKAVEKKESTLKTNVKMDQKNNKK